MAPPKIPAIMYHADFQQRFHETNLSLAPIACVSFYAPLQAHEPVKDKTKPRKKGRKRSKKSKSFQLETNAAEWAINEDSTKSNKCLGYCPVPHSGACNVEDILIYRNQTIQEWLDLNGMGHMDIRDAFAGADEKGK